MVQRQRIQVFAIVHLSICLFGPAIWDWIRLSQSHILRTWWETQPHRPEIAEPWTLVSSSQASTCHVWVVDAWMVETKLQVVGILCHPSRNPTYVAYLNSSRSFEWHLKRKHRYVNDKHTMHDYMGPWKALQFKDYKWIPTRKEIVSPSTLQGRCLFVLESVYLPSYKGR